MKTLIYLTFFVTTSYTALAAQVEVVSPQLGKSLLSELESDELRLSSERRMKLIDEAKKVFVDADNARGQNKFEAVKTLIEVNALPNGIASEADALLVFGSSLKKLPFKTTSLDSVYVVGLGDGKNLGRKGEIELLPQPNWFVILGFDSAGRLTGMFVSYGQATKDSAAILGASAGKDIKTKQMFKKNDNETDSK